MIMSSEVHIAGIRISRNALCVLAFCLGVIFALVQQTFREECKRQYSRKLWNSAKAFLKEADQDGSPSEMDAFHCARVQLYGLRIAVVESAQPVLDPVNLHACTRHAECMRGTEHASSCTAAAQ